MTNGLSFIKELEHTLISRAYRRNLRRTIWLKFFQVYPRTWAMTKGISESEIAYVLFSLCDMLISCDVIWDNLVYLYQSVPILFCYHWHESKKTRMYTCACTHTHIQSADLRYGGTYQGKATTSKEIQTAIIFITC